MQYIEIKESIVEQIEQGLLEAGQKLPSERQLADSFGTTRVTLREALSLLETDGIIFREDRRGWFIASARIKMPLTDFQEVGRCAQQQQMDYRSELLSVTTGLATKEVNVLMKLPPFSKVHWVDILHVINERPIGVSQYWIRESLRQNLPDELASDSDVSRLIFPPEMLASLTSKFSVMIKSLEGKRASQLRATAGTPCMAVRRQVIDAEEQVLLVELTQWRHDSVELV